MWFVIDTFDKDYPCVCTNDEDGLAMKFLDRQSAEAWGRDNCQEFQTFCVPI